MTKDVIPGTLSFEETNEGRRFHATRFTELRDQSQNPYAFVRCDFVQARFEGCEFNGTDFTNSDFTGAVFDQTTFTSCNMMSTAYSSCLLEKCRFFSNRNFNCDLIECAIISCEFDSQLIDRSVWRNVDVADCSFSAVTLRRSTFDGVKFSHTRISGINFMDNYCISSTFADCKFVEVDFDASYFGSNIFRGCDMSGMRLRYKDEYLEADAGDPETLESLANHYGESRQFAEAFNVNLFLDTLQSGRDLQYPVAAFAECLKRIIELKPSTLVTQQLRLLFRIADVDYRRGAMTPLDILTLDAVCSSILLSINDLTVREQIVRCASFLKDVAANLLVSDTNLSRGSKARVSLTYDDTDPAAAVERAEGLLSAIVGTKHYQIVATRPGSIIVDVLTYSGAAVVVAATLRVVSGYAVATYVEFLSAAASRRVLEKVNTLEGLQEVGEFQLTRDRINAGAAALQARHIDGLRKLEIKL